MTKQLKHADYVYSEVNFEDVYLGCANISEIDSYLAKYNFRRVATINTGCGWGDALYAKNSQLKLTAWSWLKNSINLPKDIRRKTKLYIQR